MRLKLTNDMAEECRTFTKSTLRQNGSYGSCVSTVDGNTGFDSSKANRSADNC